MYTSAQEHPTRYLSNLPLRENYEAVSIQDYCASFLLHKAFHRVLEVRVWKPKIIERLVLQYKGVVSIAKGQTGIIPQLPHIYISIKFLKAA